jgi:hypothetical protein
MYNHATVVFVLVSLQSAVRGGYACALATTAVFMTTIRLAVTVSNEQGTGACCEQQAAHACGGVCGAALLGDLTGWIM